MPHHAQFEKSLRKDEKRRMRNRAAISRLRTMIKKVRLATTKSDGEKVLQDAISIIDSTARKKIIKQNTASRNVSRLTKYVKSLP